MADNYDSLAASAMTATGNILANKVNNDANRELWEEQKEYNQELLEDEREYNTPANQMLRMLAAGINPDAAAQGISGSDATQSYDIARADTPPQMNAAHISDNALAWSVNTDWQNQLISEQIARAQKENESYYVIRDAQLEVMRSTVKSNCAKAGLDNAQTNQVIEMLPLLKNKTSVEIGKFKAETDKFMAEITNIEQQIKESNSRVDLNHEKIETEQTLQKLNSANAAVADSTVSLNHANQQLTEQKTDTEKYQTLLKEKENLMKKFEVQFTEFLGLPPDSPRYAQMLQLVQSEYGRSVIVELSNCSSGLNTHLKDYNQNAVGVMRNFWPNFGGNVNVGF